MNDMYYLSLVGYALGITLITAAAVYNTLFYNKTYMAYTYGKKGCILLGSFILFLLLLYAATQTKNLFQTINQNTTWVIQTTSVYIILLTTTTFIIKFLFQQQSIIATLFYGSSICLVLIAGRLLFLNLTHMVTLLSDPINLYANPHARFLFFVISHFFISIALLHILTKTRFLLFLPDKLLPVSAMFATSLEAAYSLSILI